jgi:hypothetical protein
MVKATANKTLIVQVTDGPAPQFIEDLKIVFILSKFITNTMVKMPSTVVTRDSRYCTCLGHRGQRDTK